MTRSADQQHICPFCDVQIRGPSIGRHIQACESRKSYGRKVLQYGRNGKQPKVAAALRSSAADMRLLATKLEAIAAALS